MAHLYLFDLPDRALALALSNWRIQREAADVRIVIEAALAAKRPEAAEPVQAWLTRRGARLPQARGQYLLAHYHDGNDAIR